MTRKILVVDDDPILRRAIEKRLAAHRESFAVVTAADGFLAVKELEKFPYSLIVVDLLMPRMDGMSLIAHVREKYPELTIVVISAMEAPAIREMIKNNGVTAFLAKPFRAADLVELITASLRQEADGGIMYDVSPTVFLQLLEMDAKTCTVRIIDKTSGRGGILYFREGRLLDARVENRGGVDAACEVFTWDVVTLYIHNGCPSRQDTVNTDLQPIIMQAAGMRDESAGPLGGDGEEDEDSPLARLKDLLRRVSGPDCVTAFSYDAQLGEAADHLQQLGQAADFGSFQTGLISAGRVDRFFLPGRPAPVFSLKPDTLRRQEMEKIRQTLPSILS